MTNSKDENGYVDVYESLAIFAILCGDELEEKLKFVYNLFDFDASGEIEEKELVMSLQSAIRGLCKFVNLPLPTL